MNSLSYKTYKTRNKMPGENILELSSSQLFLGVSLERDNKSHGAHKLSSWRASSARASLLIVQSVN